MNDSKVPLVSVILPTKNRAHLLSRSVRSILDQSYENLELIIVSDGSTDDTEEVVRQFEDERIRYYSHDHSRGASAARNTGIKSAKGKYIAFQDDDDEWLEGKLQVQVAFMEDLPPEVGMIYGWMDYLKEGNLALTRRPTLRGDILADLLDTQAISGCPTLLIRREVFYNVGLFDEGLPRGNDGDLIRRIAKSYKIDFIPKVVCRVHLDDKDRISIDSSKNLGDVISALEKRICLFQEDFNTHPVKKANVLKDLSVTCLRTGRYGKGLEYFRGMLVEDIGCRRRIILCAQYGRQLLSAGLRIFSR